VRIEAIEQALQARPFVPFRIILPSDRSVLVPHSEFVSIAPNRKWLLVWNRRGGWSLLDPGLIAELAFRKRRA
jgi:hypothetical protein